MILTAKKGDVLLIENPEAHLHPGGQVKLGELISRASAAGVQLFVETHSDHVINGVRVAIKNSVIKSEDMNILFFERKIPDESDNSGVLEQWSECREIHVDSDGEFDDYPDGFLDEWNKQVVKLWK
jgi:predicted ATPase